MLIMMCDMGYPYSHHLTKWLMYPAPKGHLHACIAAMFYLVLRMIASHVQDATKHNGA